MKEIAVVVPVYNRREITLGFLRQLPELAVEGVELQVIIVDDGSTDGTTAAIKAEFPEVMILSGDGNLWWTGAVKMGVEYALKQGNENTLIMNDDLELDRNFLAELLKVAKLHPEALVSSIKLNRQNDDGSVVIMNAGFKTVGMLKETKALFEDESYHPQMAAEIECDMLTGSSLFIPAEVFRKIGMFDAKNFPHGYGDFEFTRRASLAGFTCLVATKSKIYTEHNQNYIKPYLIRSTRIDYLRNLFNKTKFTYGFFPLRQLSYMHKNFLVGSILYGRRLIGLFRNIVLKLLLPNSLLRRLIKEKHLSDVA